MPKAKKPTQDLSEKIGFHKGSLSVLSKERQEMQKILSVVEQLMQMHLAELRDLGVDLSGQTPAEEEKAKERKPPIDELL